MLIPIDPHSRPGSQDIGLHIAQTTSVRRAVLAMTMRFFYDAVSPSACHAKSSGMNEMRSLMNSRLFKPATPDKSLSPGSSSDHSFS